ncbi:MAG TPA: HEAT repeat domain-containing protein [Acidimicrobiia bacterium]|nr:HEAT repeat domain-containing protein [Acidimicrobiia bacterium]
MGWTPATGTRNLIERDGLNQAVKELTRLLAGEITGSDLCHEPWRSVLLSIGDGHAERLMNDPSGARLAYWPRSWAARALAYAGDPAAAPALLSALADPHWRVRMTAIQTLGRLEVEGVTDELVAALADEHPRVRAAAAVALRRLGA